jgi:hypothetical protein
MRFIRGAVFSKGIGCGCAIKTASGCTPNRQMFCRKVALKRHSMTTARSMIRLRGIIGREGEHDEHPIDSMYIL